MKHLGLCLHPSLPHDWKLPKNPVSRDINSQTCEKRKQPQKNAANDQKKNGYKTKENKEKHKKRASAGTLGVPRADFHHSGVALGSFSGALGWFGSALGRSWNALGTLLGRLGRLLGAPWTFWMQFGKILGSGITLLDIFWGGLGPLFPIFSHLFRIFGAS